MSSIQRVHRGEKLGIINEILEEPAQRVEAYYHQRARFGSDRASVKQLTHNRA